MPANPTSDLMNIVGQRVGGEPTKEVEHFYTCATCGQSVDMRHLGEVFRHEEAGHEPVERQ